MAAIVRKCPSRRGFLRCTFLELSAIAGYFRLHRPADKPARGGSTLGNERGPGGLEVEAIKEERNPIQGYLLPRLSHTPPGTRDCRAGCSLSPPWPSTRPASDRWSSFLSAPGYQRPTTKSSGVKATRLTPLPILNKSANRSPLLATFRKGSTRKV